ncbi:hypothetical protein NONI108955_21010 [Nocardia ninae]|uniref:Uncharacterized protein n=1 Tax=Nocardia ninae NBRC 108245 TaxID=1210091 RepID=A0A511M9U4_9NOCA|nr:hypothetical protein [Nocardia ninae]GEM37434.1 hypothetical protein NN4_19530 [Nocardia ninae NBRC 108245]
MGSRFALHTDESFVHDDGVYVIAVEDGVKGYQRHDGPWPTLEEAQAYVDAQNADLGLSPEQARAMVQSSHFGVPSAVILAEQNPAGRDGEVRCRHGNAIGSQIGCQQCQEQERAKHLAEVVGIEVPWLSDRIQVRCVLCGCAADDSGHVGTPISAMAG